MSKFDYSDISGKLLQLHLAVLETGAITAAAQRLGVTQSAVSHSLEKLRSITGDALFVKSGRGIVPTAHAQGLAEQARGLLSGMERFTQSGRFDPLHWQARFTIAANNFQRDVLLPPLLQRLRQKAPGVLLHVIPSGIPSLEMLRQQQCQLVLSPRPPDGGDILQKRLFEDRYQVFYDPAQRGAPASRADYLGARHVTVVYEGGRPLDLDQWMLTRGVRRQFAVTVQDFSGLGAFVQGSDLLATAPALLLRHMPAGLAAVAPPLPCPRLPMFMVWHMRHQHDAAHRWLRGELQSLVSELLKLQTV